VPRPRNLRRLYQPNDFQELEGRPNTIAGFQIVDAASTTSDNTFTGTQTFALRSYLGGATVPSDSFTGNVIWGVRSGDAASAGQIGETIKSVISAATNAAATGTYLALTSIALTPGDWSIVGAAQSIPNGATHTVGGNLRLAVGTTSASATGAVRGESLLLLAHNTVSEYASMTTPTIRVNLSASTTYYLNVMQTYSAGTPQWTGSIVATRVR
jgi:hypothetical protein